jgi:hypothetical protein
MTSEADLIDGFRAAAAEIERDASAAARRPEPVRID